MAAVTLQGVSKRFGAVAALSALDLAVEDGEFVALLGPSGCGKTTTLNLVAGLVTPSAGAIRIGARDVTALPAMDRDIAMVFQSYALYPHMSVERNLGFALTVRREDPAAIRRKVREAAEMLGLGPYLGRYPRQLSGGQRQRVALGRALVRDPAVFLLDEPLSNLDAVLRVRTRAEIARLFRRLRTTALYVTHDQAEAMTMADRIAVFRDGRLLQFAPPLEIYRAPACAFVAGFVGAPPMAFLDAVATGAGLRAGALDLPAPVPLAPGAHVRAGLRPEDLAPAEPGSPGAVPAEVDLVEHLGGLQVVSVLAAGQPLAFQADAARRFRPGERLALRVPARAVYLFDAETGRTLAAPGLPAGPAPAAAPLTAARPR